MRHSKPLGMVPRSRVSLMGIIGAADLLGIEVVDQEGTRIGHLCDIMLDLRRNRIAYGVVALKAERPDGERQVAVPWSALFQDGDADRFFINAPRARIEQAPMLTAGDEGVLDGDAATFVHAWFDTKPYWDQAQRFTYGGGGVVPPGRVRR